MRLPAVDSGRTNTTENIGATVNDSQVGRVNTESDTAFVVKLLILRHRPVK